MNYWIEKTIIGNRLDRLEGDRAVGKALWSPQRSRKGADIYKNMRKVEKDDIIIHLVNNTSITGVSIVKEKAIKTNGISGTEWDGPAYLIELKDYRILKPELHRDEILNQNNKPLLDKINQKSEVFYTKDLELRQGAYLTPCPQELVNLINLMYYDITGKNLPHIQNSIIKNTASDIMEFSMINIQQNINKSGLLYPNLLLTRFIASLLTKPFVILTGLSGSGKTKLAQAFVQWICEDENQYKIIPVGADWTNREPLLGYPNALQNNEYVLPENGVLKLLIDANENKNKPYFLVLDEMNLSIVERYFADFLSAMESDEKIPLHSFEKATCQDGKINIPSSISIPKNLYIIGTVNIDETTHMFSPKVLDRANTIEFRITKNEMDSFFQTAEKIDMDVLKGQGAGMSESFIALSEKKDFQDIRTEEITTSLLNFFEELQEAGAEYGYRSASEMLELIYNLKILDPDLSDDKKLDITIIQKLLPKLHGSRRKLTSRLETLGKFCFENPDEFKTDFLEKPNSEIDNEIKIRYPLSLNKIARMYKSAIENGFASFAEA